MFLHHQFPLADLRFNSNKSICKFFQALTLSLKMNLTFFLPIQQFMNSKRFKPLYCAERIQIVHAHKKKAQMTFIRDDKRGNQAVGHGRHIAFIGFQLKRNVDLEHRRAT